VIQAKRSYTCRGGASRPKSLSPPPTPSTLGVCQSVSQCQLPDREMTELMSPTPEPRRPLYPTMAQTSPVDLQAQSSLAPPIFDDINTSSPLACNGASNCNMKTYVISRAGYCGKCMRVDASPGRRERSVSLVNEAIDVAARPRAGCRLRVGSTSGQNDNGDSVYRIKFS